jgi:hypothetical protein
MAEALRRYRAEWKAALARRDYTKTRAILRTALSAVSKDAGSELDIDTRALHELLALERRLQSITDGEAPARIPPARHAFGLPSTRRFRGPWDRAIGEANHAVASKVLRRAIAALSRRMARRTRAQQTLINRLRRLQRTPLEFSPVPARCAFCGGTDDPGIDSGRLFVCTDCIQQAYEILAEAGGRQGAKGAT